MNEYMSIYIEEVKEHLESIDEVLLQLEKSPSNKDLLNQIFRSAHTIKGSSGAMGFTKMESLTHGMEDVLQDIRDGKILADKKIVELLFICHDFLENCIDSISRTGNEDKMSIDNLLFKLHSIVGEKHSKINPAKETETEKKHVEMELDLGREEWDKIAEEVEKGKNAYVITVTLRNDCILKSVRAWMIFNEIEGCADIVKSAPQKPTEEEFKSEKFRFDEDRMKIAILTDETYENILRTIETVSEIEKACIEPIEINKEDTGGIRIKLVQSERRVCFTDLKPDNESKLIDEIIGENKEAEINIDEIFLSDFIRDINEHTLKIDAYIETMEQETELNKRFYTVFRFFHTIKGMASFIENKDVEKVAEKTEIYIDFIRKGLISPDNNTNGVFRKSCEIIRKLCQADGAGDEEVNAHVNLLDGICGTIIPESMNEDKQGVSEKDINSDAITEEVSKTTNSVGSETQEHAPSNEQFSGDHGSNKVKSVVSSENSYIRIPIQKVDNLVDMLGELQIMHSLFSQDTEVHMNNSDKYLNNIDRMAKLIKRIQNLSMSLRMVSIKTTFQKILRIARDTGVELGKDINIVISGEDTEVDRNIAEKILDPLMHLVRNSVSHGIEDRDERLSKGKNVQGLVSIKAYSKRGNVYIEVEDDGSGLPIEKIWKKAKDSNLIDPSRTYSDDEIIKFIFLPGFSTQSKINNISGRGVGMNVVETEIIKLGGKVDIVNKPGSGCLFKLRIPMNLAVINGTLVDISGSKYIIPTIFIKKFLKPEDNQWVNVKGKKISIKDRDEIIQLIPIYEALSLEPELESSEESMIVIIELEQKLKALPVKSILGRLEVVTKSLGSEFSNLNFASGASILGDGKVALILDVEALFSMEYEN